MKTFLSLLVPALFAVSCAPSTPQSRIARNPDLYARLGTRDKERVQHGEIAKGMPPEAVWLAWGEPASRYEGSKDGKPSQRWVYTTSEPVYSTGFYGGWGPYYRPYSYGYRGYGYGMSLGPEITYVPSLRGSVLFQNNRVESWERKR